MQPGDPAFVQGPMFVTNTDLAHPVYMNRPCIYSKKYDTRAHTAHTCTHDVILYVSVIVHVYTSHCYVGYMTLARVLYCIIDLPVKPRLDKPLIFEP